MCALMVALLDCASSPLLGQSDYFRVIQTLNGPCRVWIPIPGGSNQSDQTYNKCSIAQSPELLAGAPMPPAPFLGDFGGGSLIIVVKPDGTTDPQLTRWSTTSGDSMFIRQAMETFDKWKFKAGIRDGKKVRSGFELDIWTDTRNDTAASRLEWTYRKGWRVYSLIGKWYRTASAPPLTTQQSDSVYVAATRRLRRMQVLVSAPQYDNQRRCIVALGSDSVAQSHLASLVRPLLPSSDQAGPTPPAGCEHSVNDLRLVFPPVVTTENGRVVVAPSGDYLPHYPPGFDGRCRPHLQGLHSCISARINTRGMANRHFSRCTHSAAKAAIDCTY